MLGIALGSFTQGFMNGIQLGTTLKGVRKQNRLDSSVEGITAEGKQQFDADVKAGKADEGDFNAFYANHLVPKIANEYLKEGEPDKAQAWMDWADTSAAKKASKQFGKGLQLLQMGETQSGIDAMIKAADTNGYGPDGKTTAAEIYDEEAGKVTGYRLTYTLPDGKQHTKNVATEDLPNFFAATINPQSAFELQQASAAAQSKADLEVETYTRKKAAEKELGVSPGQMTQAQYQNAVQEERKRIEESALTDPDIGGLGADEKEALAKDTVDKRLGLASSAPAQDQVAVDPTTGEQVQLPSTPTQDATQQQVQPRPAVDNNPQVDPGAGPTDADLGAMSAPQDSGVAEPTADTAPGVTAPSPAEATSQVPATDRETQITRAAQLMKQGGNGVEIAKALIAAGVPPQQWPQAVQLAVQSAQPGISR